MEQTANGVRQETTVDLPTRFGRFRLAAFSAGAGDGRNDGCGEHLAIIHGTVTDAEHCPVRVHSQCLTGEVFGSQRCDCREQLDAALRHVAAQPCGAVIYLRQEGRGIGLLNKLHAYRLQDQGMDTIDANRHLGFPDDARDYGIAARILEVLRVRSVMLMTNNPRKVEGLRAEGITVTDRIPLVTSGNRFNRDYLETKRTRLGHLL